jgi:hypothetical protein
MCDSVGCAIKREEKSIFCPLDRERASRLRSTSLPGSVLASLPGWILAWLRTCLVAWLRGWILVWLRGWILAWLRPCVVGWLGPCVIGGKNKKNDLGNSCSLNLLP